MLAAVKIVHAFASMCVHSACVHVGLNKDDTKGTVRFVLSTARRVRGVCVCTR